MSLAARLGAWLLPWPLLAASIGGAVPMPASPDEAQDAYALGLFDQARRLWTPRAEAGDARAQVGLGVLYDLGQGVPRDPAMAYHWYRRAAEGGLAEAQFNVAVMHDTGETVPRDPGEAAIWYARAAAHGNRRAQYNLGQLYESGQGVPHNLDQAQVWYGMAAIGLPAAGNKLAALRKRGPGRDSGRGPGRAAGRIEAPVPAEPADGRTVERRDGPAEVELVWLAPAQPVPVRFFVQLWALDDAGSREAHSAYVDASATLVPLEQVPGRYAWRVYAVDRDAKHYAAGPWSRFTVGPPER